MKNETSFFSLLKLPKNVFIAIVAKMTKLCEDILEIKRA